MEAIALLLAATAAASVTLIVIALLGSGRRTATDRLAAYPTAAPVVGEQKPGAASQPSLVVGSSFILSSLSRLLQRSAWSERVARDLGRADLVLTPAEYLAFRAAAVLGAIGLCWLLGATLLPALSNPWALVAATVIGYVLPRLYVARRQASRLKAFNDGLADTVVLVGNALRAGSSLLQSLELVSRESRPPISTEFGRVVREVSFGLSLEQALNNLVERVKSDDLELLATAIAIQYQVGGNLSEILETIAFTIRERVRIKGEIRTLTAQQRLSGYVVGFLPVGLLGLLMVIAPKFIDPLFEKPPEVYGLPGGVLLLAFGGLMMMIGFYFIRRIVDIEV